MPIDFDFRPYFERYRKLVEKVDEAFDVIRQQCPGEVRCQIGCADCCHALFDLSLIEAIYINHCFQEAHQGLKRERLLERASRADRDTYRIKRSAYRDLQAGKSEEEVLANMARQRVRCSMLNDEDRCEIYPFRPITCRAYGVPTSIRGQGHTCGMTGFKPGEPYPTVNLDALYQQLYQISAEMVAEMKSRHVKMAEVLVPLSMALITVYDETYLGLGEEEPEQAVSTQEKRAR
ncbi:MAG: YkgJ family cysteine cluster protein [Desulfobacterales bacterium]|jgi:Fe-S-cluster containining protein